MSGFSFPSNLVKMLSLTIDCSAGILPDLVRRFLLIWQSCQSPFAGSYSLCQKANRRQWWEKRWRLQSLQRLPLPIAHLCPGRSDSEHLSLLPSFCNCSFRPFWLYASRTRLHSNHTDPLSASFLKRLLSPVGNDLHNLTAFPCCSLI